MALALSLSFQVSDGSPFRRRSPYVVKDEHPVPSEWQRAGRAPSNQLVNLRIGLKHGRLEELERHLDEGSATLYPSLKDSLAHRRCVCGSF